MMKGRITLLLAAAIARTSATNIDPVALLMRLQTRIRDSAGGLPRYVCRQNIQRQVFAPVTKASRPYGKLPEPISDPPNLDVLIGLSDASRGFILVSSERANVDVMLGRGTELGWELVYQTAQRQNAASAP